MNAAKAMLSLALFALTATTSASALAWHRGGHAHFGLYFGAPAYWSSPYYYPPYYPAYGYPVLAPAAPPVYIEQDGAASAPAQPQAQADWWYYCAEAKAYYPYVKECAAGWQRVAPQPQR